MTPAIQAKGLSYAYGERTALSGINLRVSPGEIFGLLGPNGGGKTTLFKILATLLSPSQGSVNVFGMDVVRDADAIRRRIGVVFQDPALDPHLTVSENLHHQGHLYGMRGKGLKKRIEAVVARLGLSPHKGDLVSRLSGGMRRRADLARGLLHEPELLILDEPSTGLDPSARKEFREDLGLLREREGVTVLLTTHLLDEADGCDRIGILDRGKLVALDKPEILKRSVGEEVVSLRVRSPEIFQKAVQERLGLETIVVDATVRVECHDGQKVMIELLRAFDNEIDSVTLGKPNLEDVFIHKTGTAWRSEVGGQGKAEAVAVAAAGRAKAVAVASSRKGKSRVRGRR